MTIADAANLGAQLTGLPASFTQALISTEGSWGTGNWQNGQIINNPYDVTSDWASIAGYGGSVMGQGGSQGNIASFSDPEVAVQAWAAGINSFSNYANFRTLIHQGANAYDLALALQQAGYAGDDPQYATKISGSTGQSPNGGNGPAPVGSSVQTQSISLGWILAGTAIALIFADEVFK